MVIYLTRLSIVLLGVLALTGGVYNVSNVRSKGAQNLDLQRFEPTFRLIDLKTDEWGGSREECACDADKKPKSAAPKTKKEKTCDRPSPAERMGMAIRLVSL